MFAASAAYCAFIGSKHLQCAAERGTTFGHTIPRTYTAYNLLEINKSAEQNMWQGLPRGDLHDFCCLAAVKTPQSEEAHMCADVNHSPSFRDREVTAARVLFLYKDFVIYLQ